MIRFVSLVVEGFGSIGSPIKFDLDRGGVNVIRGKNGHGKTTMFSALAWVLYKISLKGLTASKVSTWDHKQPAGYRGTRGCVEWVGHDGSVYLAARHKDFKGTTLGRSIKNGLVIFKDGEPLNEESLHSGDYDAELVKLLGVDSKTFLNALLFGQGLDRLAKAKDDEKRNLFDVIFDTDFVAKAKEKGKLEQSEKQIELSALKNSYDGKEALLEQRKVSYREQKNILDFFEEDKQNNLKLLANKVSVAEDKLSDQQVKVEQLQDAMAAGPRKNEEKEKLQDRYSELRNSINLVNDTIQKLARSIKTTNEELETSKSKQAKLSKDLEEVSDTCTYCGGPLKKENVESVKKKIRQGIDAEKAVQKTLSEKLPQYEKDKTASEEELSTLKLDSSNISEELEKFSEDAVDPYVLAKSNIIGAKERLAELELEVSGLKGEHKAEQDKKPPKNNLVEIEAEIKDLKTAMCSIKKEIASKESYLEDLSWWVSKGFGASGIKSFIYKAMMGSLNDKILKYAERLGVGIQFYMDLSGVRAKFEILCYVDGEQVDYLELSGGEKQRVDICLSFAMHSLITDVTPINILILDEVFEGLDEDGREIVFDLIRMKADEGKTVFVVTHSNEIDSMYTKSVVIEKVNGLTRVG
jgi:DNA repair exonuclease SbcCD ATPase subunit